MSSFSRHARVFLLAGCALFISMAAYPSARAADNRTAGTIPHKVSPPDDPPRPVYHSFDDDRMAGAKKKIPEPSGEKTDTEKKSSAPEKDNPSKKTATAKSAVMKPAPAEKKQKKQEKKAVPGRKASTEAFAASETEGLLDTTLSGSLGIDVWDGSKRSEIRALLEKPFTDTPYRAIFALTRRLLLTKTDPAFLSDDEKPEPGKDFLTLRLNRLMDMGLYDDAAKLYALTAGTPYDDNAASTGITALLMSRQRALGCLEIESLRDSFGTTPFWEKFTPVCRQVMERLAPAASIDTAVSVSSDNALKEITGEKKFRITPKKPEELETFSREELAALMALERIDYSKLGLSRTDNIKPAVLGAMLGDALLPEHLRFVLMVKAAEKGIKASEDLAAYYNTFKFDSALDEQTAIGTVGNLPGWKQIPYLYQAASKYKREKGDPSALLLDAALSRGDVYGENALLPFSGMIPGTPPSGMRAESIRTALKIIAGTNGKMYSGWQKELVNQIKNSNQEDKNIWFLYLLAFETDPDSPRPNITEHFDMKSFFGNLPPHHMEIVKMLYKILDTEEKLHNYTASNAVDPYDKGVLTTSDDYVMPLGGLLDNLKLAIEDKRLGEVVLLSSVALRDAPPEKIFPGTLNEAVAGLKTVGLTADARGLVREAILGLK